MLYNFRLFYKKTFFNLWPDNPSFGIPLIRHGKSIARGLLADQSRAMMLSCLNYDSG